MNLPIVKTGLQCLLGDRAGDFKSKRSGLILHPASLTADFKLAADALCAAGFKLDRLFGPQHGARGEKQDNMKESDNYRDADLGLTVHSLYGAVRKPTAEMLAGLDVLFFDLQDVGVRVYTFIWTMVLAMEACAAAGVKFVVLDRPNPLGGIKREGPLLKKGYESFVGLHPIPLRHGLTCGELAQWLNMERNIHCELEIIPCQGLHRRMTWMDTGLAYIMPSPNLPTPDSCAVYPGMVLLEGTNISEGRGTTRPFEIFGAPWLDGHLLVSRLSSLNLPGVIFRPTFFEPTFGKYAGKLCGGAQIHVTDHLTFESVRGAIEILVAVRERAPDEFNWLSAPYEYEERLLPIDILWGSDKLRKGLENGLHADEILAGTETELQNFAARLNPYLLYE